MSDSITPESTEAPARIWIDRAGSGYPSKNFYTVDVPGGTVEYVRSDIVAELCAQRIQVTEDYGELAQRFAAIQKERDELAMLPLA